MKWMRMCILYAQINWPHKHQHNTHTLTNQLIRQYICFIGKFHLITRLSEYVLINRTAHSRIHFLSVAFSLALMRCVYLFCFDFLFCFFSFLCFSFFSLIFRMADVFVIDCVAEIQNNVAVAHVVTPWFQPLVGSKKLHR